MIEGPATFLLAILGCGEGETACRPVAVSEARYESEASCMAASADQLARQDSLDFPVLVAECRRAGEMRVPLQASAVQLPEPQRRLPRTSLASR
jgi:hypothetical protein